MSTVAEIEDALNKLPETEFEEVALVVLERLRKFGHLPPFREFSEDQVHNWIAEDETNMTAFRARSMTLFLDTSTLFAASGS